MKTLLTTIFLTGALLVFGQTTYKQGKKYVKHDRAIKEARKEAKKWEKEGFQNTPGNLSLEIQFERALVKRVLLDDQGVPRYISVSGSAISGSESVAQANALDNTRAILAGQIQSDVSALVSNNKANTGYTAEEIETIDEFISNSKTLIQKELGIIRPEVEMVRRVDDKYEYRLTILYDLLEAKKVTKEIVKRDLKDKLSKNEEDLNKILGL